MFIIWNLLKVVTPGVNVSGLLEDLHRLLVLGGCQGHGEEGQAHDHLWAKTIAISLSDALPETFVPSQLMNNTKTL